MAAKSHPDENQTPTTNKNVKNIKHEKMHKNKNKKTIRLFTKNLCSINKIRKKQQCFLKFSMQLSSSHQAQTF